jgi:hypothetical protein
MKTDAMNTVLSIRTKKTIKLLLKPKKQGWGCSSGVKHLPSMHNTLVRSPALQNKKTQACFFLIYPKNLENLLLEEC